jgi:predicted PurR-regulated permease PerM
MDKKLLRSILLAITFAVFLVAIILNINKISGVFSFIWGIVTPIAIGFCIAFLLNRPFCFFVRIFEKLFRKAKKPHPKAVKALATITVYIVFLAIAALLFGLIVPQLISSVVNLYNNRNVYIDNFTSIAEWLEKTLGLNISIADSVRKFVMDLLEKLPENFIKSIPEIFAAAGGVASTVINVLMGFAMSVYMLASKDLLLKQCRRCLYAFVPEKAAVKTSEIMGIASDVFGDYLGQRLLDALIVGVLCFICMTVIGLPYAILISTIIAITNVIPFFGPFIGAIPSAFILLIGKPINALWFIIMIIVLQQLNEHLISPRLTVRKTDIPIWITFVALFIGGGLGSLFGMLVAVPTSSVIYKIIKEAVSKRAGKETEEKAEQ